MTQAYSEKKSECSNQESNLRPSDYYSSDSLPLSYRRLVGAKAIKLGSFFMGQTSCILLGLECQCVAYAQWK